jgi:hypothetical protein
MKRITMAFGSVLVLGTLLVVAAQAASPTKGATYKGKVSGVPTDERDFPVEQENGIRLKVSSTGRRVDVRGPHACPQTFNPNWAFHGQIKRLKVSSTGVFKGSRTYTDTSLGENYVLHWTIKVSGKFVSARKAKGTITYEMSQSGRSPTPTSCGKQSGPWTALRK